MRTEFSRQMLAFLKRTHTVFLTGDLGFNAFEELREEIGPRFINAGIAEQNMVSIGAGLCNRGFLVFAYSIAPFCYARPFEQIRNDVCLHSHPLTLVGNGGGYGYGVQGPSHHALEDYGVLTTLPELKAYIPAFSTDLGGILRDIEARRKPGYLRLGRCELPADCAPGEYAPWRRLLDGETGVVVAVGPLNGAYLAAFRAIAPAARPELWALGELPVPGLPADLVKSLSNGKPLLVAEEHVVRGGAGEALAHFLLRQGMTPARFHHHHAGGYPSGRYGSQHFHREESRLDARSILDRLSRG
jgi:transketolase